MCCRTTETKCGSGSSNTADAKRTRSCRSPLVTSTLSLLSKTDPNGVGGRSDSVLFTITLVRQPASRFLSRRKFHQSPIGKLSSAGSVNAFANTLASRSSSLTPHFPNVRFRPPVLSATRNLCCHPSSRVRSGGVAATIQPQHPCRDAVIHRLATTPTILSVQIMEAVPRGLSSGFRSLVWRLYIMKKYT